MPAAEYVVDEAALREARCECGHWALRHANAGCLLCDECERPPAAALLAWLGQFADALLKTNADRPATEDGP